MRLLYLWPLIFLILIPVIIIMYLLKQKAVERPVSSLFLWNEMYQNAEANTPWEKLKKNWLLILQIITLLILIAALCSPYLLKGGVGADQVVIVVDQSASMGTLYEGETTRLEAAVKEAVSYVKGLKSGTRITIIASAEDAVLLYTNGDDKGQAVNVLQEIPQTLLTGDATPGMDMVRSMMSQWTSVETVCFTDTYTNMEGIEGYMVDFYRPVENVSVDYVGHGENEKGTAILSMLTNHGTNEVSCDVNLYGGESLLQIQTVTLAGGENKVVYFENIDYDGYDVSVELSLQDALRADNICYDVLYEQESMDVLFMTEANLYFEKAMGIVEGVNVTKSNDIASFADFQKENYDLYIFDGMVPDVLPETGNMIFMNISDTELFDSDSYLEGVLVEPAEHALTTYLEELTFGVSRTYVYAKPDWADSFLKSGSDCIGFAGEYDGRSVCVMGFDLHNSELPLKSEFPILVYNMINSSARTSLVDIGSYTPGTAVSIRGKFDEEMPVVTLPDGKEKKLQDYHHNFTDTSEQGVYRVSQQTAKETVVSGFCINFPIAESNITQVPAEVQGEEGEQVKTTVTGMLDLRNLIILLALLFLGVEWIAYLRR